ncbi:uncharacterized protein AMSG_03110 [Thecamonas trahens ATCC 50062]|uniref:Glycosyltransferase subfamily 4-like N-terminal domain-containing protein n=1 Tax=Thecamonas trahens ATCC 50062 TaxID=461836 RepID=A0A0L0D5U2_THETB|nr:hypothetical protein AMSG_03110 [Thecamonas trahens ATCC 50062]KNC46673.1 hypothetical protein AMSG_03110 [Thecamonas trahens ATCC 50062]|eukprot:XP_013760443.1 hypothetical protein AMSG_03110 [Thecamonas trahens ATCC 50062]
MGDVGHSPRMQYHACSLAQLPSSPRVSLVGYAESPLPAAVAAVTDTVALGVFPRLPRWLFPLYAPFKVVYMAWVLFYALAFRLASPPDILLVQNPPSVPVLAVCWLYTALIARSCRLVVDWHNFGYTILAYSLPRPLRWVASLAAAYERFFGSRASAHLAVTRAMAAWLEANWGIAPVVLYDRPPNQFVRLSPDERLAFIARLPELIDGFDPAAAALLAPNRPAFLVSSTSWTPDEDFSILLEAMVAYNALVEAQNPDSARALPDVVLVITGRGPLKAHYEAAIADLGLAHVSIFTAFLPIADYPRILGAADLGISLHTSSSGLDLPIKIIDAFGAGLPVAAVNFPCLHELVVDGYNGVVFDSAPDLAAALSGLFAGFPRSTKALENLADGAAAFQSLRWDENWNTVARPLMVGNDAPVVYRKRE